MGAVVSEPTWKKRGCGTSLFTWPVLLARVALTRLAAGSCCWWQRDDTPIWPSGGQR